MERGARQVIVLGHRVRHDLAAEQQQKHRAINTRDLYLQLSLYTFKVYYN